MNEDLETIYDLAERISAITKRLRMDESRSVEVYVVSVEPIGVSLPWNASCIQGVFMTADRARAFANRLESLNPPVKALIVAKTLDHEAV